MTALMTQGSASVTVRVLDDDGNPIKGIASIKLISTAPETTFLDGRSTFSAPTKEGVATLDQVPGGEYVVEVTTSEFPMGRDKMQVLGANSSNLEVIKLHAFDGSDDQTQLEQPGVPKLPDDLRKELQLALTALDANKAAPAETRIRDVMKHAPENPDVHYAAGSYADHMGQFAEAQKEYEAAIKLFPDHFAANFALGDLFLVQNQAAASLPYLLKAESVGPNSWRVHWRLAEAYLHANRDATKATFEANRALQLGKEKAADAEIPLALAEALQGKSGDARTLLEKFLHDHPHDPGVPEAQGVLSRLPAPRPAGNP
jgi:tetratricopeptide (TPR) repeat protein